MTFVHCKSCDVRIAIAENYSVIYADKPIQTLLCKSCKKLHNYNMSEDPKIPVRKIFNDRYPIYNFKTIKNPKKVIAAIILIILAGFSTLLPAPFNIPVYLGLVFLAWWCGNGVITIEYWNKKSLNDVTVGP